MEISDINRFIKKGDAVPSSFYETVVSFSNTDGGTILLGVDDNGKITGIEKTASVKLQKDIITALNARECINPPVFVQPIIIEHPEGTIMVVQIPASSQIHDHAGKIYSREFETDINISDNQQKISAIYLRKRNFFTESIIYPHLQLEDLDLALFEKARQIIRNNKSDHPWLLVNEERMLRDSTLWRKDYNTGKEGLTLAAALIFGKDSTIQSILPAYKVEAMVRIHNKDRWDDRINPPLRTNLIDTYLKLKQFIEKYLPEKFYQEEDQRIDLRDKIFREVIGNIIVHREYTSALSSEIIISETEIRFTNPNKPLFYGVIDPNGFNPYPKNPNIRKFFTSFGWTDEIGSGIRNTYKYLPLYIKGAAPVFKENDTFTTEIPLKLAHLGQFAKQWIQWLRLKADFTEHLAVGLDKIVLNSNLFGATWEELLLFLVPTWQQKGTQLPILNWPDNQNYKSEEIKMVPGWSENGTQLLKKKAWYLISILSLCSVPIKMKELMAAFDYKNEKSFRDNYLMPLRKARFIGFTNPENPTDPENRYTITKTGMLFLGGKL